MHDRVYNVCLLLFASQVDSFFFISAFFATYLLLGHLTKSYNKASSVRPFVSEIPSIYLMRWLRLTPTYAYVVLMYWQVLRVVGTGPFGGMQFDVDDKLCREGWWTNFLYINNLITQEANGLKGQSCYGISWYLANDFQFFLFTPFVALLAFWNHRVTLVLLLAAVLASATYANIAASDEHWPLHFFSQSTSNYVSEFYIKPWTRCPPYIIGSMLAIVWWFYFREAVKSLPSRLGTPSRILSRGIVVGLSAIAFALFGLLAFGGQSAYDGFPSLWSNQLTSAYVAWSKPLWALALAIMSLLLFLDEGGLINSLLECRLLAILSRLSFCAYLIHPAVLNWYYDSLTAPPHFTDIW